MKIAVIGGAGRMGRWLIRYFSSRGHQVIISDVKLGEARAMAEAMGVELAQNNVEAVKSTDLIMVSTPIRITPKVVNEIALHVRKGAIVAEISSLKANSVKALTKLAKLNVRPLSIHPLFGPGAQKLTGRKIAVVPILNSEVESKLVKGLFPEAEITVTNVEEHDRAMAITLSLPHFMNIAFAHIISDEDLAVLRKLEGPTFKLQLTLAESVMTEDPALQASLQMNNKHASRYLKKFLSKAKTIEKWIADKDDEKIIECYIEIQSSLSKDTDFAKSYERMYKILERL